MTEDGWQMTDGRWQRTDFGRWNGASGPWGPSGPTPRREGGKEKTLKAESSKGRSETNITILTSKTIITI
jgi:hypothetical protein